MEKNTIEKKYSFVKGIGKIVETEFIITENSQRDKVGYKLNVEYIIDNQTFVNSLKSYLNINEEHIINKKFKPGDIINIKYSLFDSSLIILDDESSYKYLLLIGLIIILFSLNIYLLLYGCILSVLCVSIYYFKFYTQIIYKAHSKNYIETQGELFKLLRSRNNDYDIVYFKLIKFVYNGKAFFCFSSYSSKSNEENYVVKFDPNNPKDCVIKYENVRWFLLLISIFGIIISIYAFIVAISGNIVSVAF